MDRQSDYYAYRIIYSPDDEEFVGLCAEFPSLSWLDETPDKALEGIRKVVSEVVADMRGNKEDVPDPISRRKFSGKISLRITPETHRNLAIRAAEEGVSLNRYINSKLVG